MHYGCGLREASKRMTDESQEEDYGVLAQHRLGQRGLAVKLDRGFEEGTYCAYVEFENLASQIGFQAARRQALKYCNLLKGQLGRFSGFSLDNIEDASREAAPGRKRDLELTYLCFSMVSSDGRFHDETVTEAFRLAVGRVGQQWDQMQARAAVQRQDSRREHFLQKLEKLLSGPAYSRMDEATKQRLLDEVPALAFSPRGMNYSGGPSLDFAWRFGQRFFSSACPFTSTAHRLAIGTAHRKTSWSLAAKKPMYRGRDWVLRSMGPQRRSS